MILYKKVCQRAIYLLTRQVKTREYRWSNLRNVGSIFNFHLSLTRNSQYLLPLQLQGNAHTCLALWGLGTITESFDCRWQSLPWPQDVMKCISAPLCLDLVNYVKGCIVKPLRLFCHFNFLSPSTLFSCHHLTSMSDS